MRLWAQSEIAGGQAANFILLSDLDSAGLWEQLAGEDSVSIDQAGAASQAMRAWELVCEWQVQAAPEWSAAGLSPDQQVFLRWMGAYREQLRAASWLDRPQLEMYLGHDVRAGLFDQLGSVSFVGFDVWTPAREAFRDALASRGIEAAILEDPALEGSRRRVECANDAAELERAARWARAHAETSPAAEICVIVRDLDARAEEARRVFMDVFCPDWRTRPGHQLPVNFSYGRALSQQPRIAAALNLLWLAQGDTDYQRYSLALRTPFLVGGRDEANQRAQLDLQLRDRLGATFRLKDALGYAKHGAPGFADVLQTLASVGADRTRERSLGSWAEWIAATLKQVGWPGEETLDSMAYQELEAWKKLLRDVADSARVHKACSLASALAILSRQAAERIHQPEGGSGVVQVMGLLEAAGHQFDAVWIAGMAAEDWPAPANPNPLIPFSLQRRLDMPGSSPARELKYATALTERLVSSSRDVVFSWPGERDGEALHASGLIEAISIEEPQQCWSDTDWVHTMLGAGKLELVTDDKPLPWPPERRARGGSSLFQMQASCPLRAFLEYRLGATDIKAPVTGINYKQRGTVAHNVLEQFYTRYPDSARLRSLADDAAAVELSALITAELATLPGASRPFLRAAASLEHDRLLGLLLEFVQLDRERGDFRVLRVEADNSHVVVGPLTLRLQLDRLDQLATGERVVIDYKTGQVKKNEWNPARPGNMQLPLYATFTGDDPAGVAFAQVSAHGVGYDGIGEQSIAIRGIETPDRTRTYLHDLDGNKLEDWAALTAAWRSVIVGLAEQFANGDCSINPKRPDDAAGQLAVLSRIYDLPGTGEEV